MRSLSIDDRVDRAAEYQLRKGTELLDGMSTDLRRYLAGNISEIKPKYPVPRLETRALSSESWHEHKFKWRCPPEAARTAWPKISFSGKSEERQESRLRNYIDTKYWTNPHMQAFRATTIHHTEVSPAVFADSNRERIRRILRHRELDASRVSNPRNRRPSNDRSFGRELNQTMHSILNTSARSKSKSAMSKTSKTKPKSSKKSVNFEKRTISNLKKLISPTKQQKVATTKLLNSIKRLTNLLDEKTNKAWY